MAISQPTSSDKLNSPDHAKLHRVLGIDNTASDQAIEINSNDNLDLTTNDLEKNGSVVHLDFVNNETPSGTIDGSNKTFTLANTPNPSSSLQLFLNGMYQAPGGEDYSLSGATITFQVAPPSGSVIKAFYRY